MAACSGLRPKNKGEMIRVGAHGRGELKREQAAASATTPAGGQLT
jgi:hypothetical protein